MATRRLLDYFNIHSGLWPGHMRNVSGHRASDWQKARRCEDETRSNSHVLRGFISMNIRQLSSRCAWKQKIGPLNLLWHLTQYLLQGLLCSPAVRPATKDRFGLVQRYVVCHLKCHQIFARFPTSKPHWPPRMCAALRISRRHFKRPR